MHIKKKILFTYQNAVLLASIIPIIVFGILTYNNSKDDATQTTFDHIETINTHKKKIIQDYFHSLEFNMYELTKTVSFLEEQAKNNIVTIQILQRNNIKDHYHAIENDIISLSKKDIFQYIYSFLNRKKEVNSVYFENIKAYKNGLGLKNILMISQKGKILYSSDEQALIGTSVDTLTEAFQKAFKDIKATKKIDGVYFTDFGYEKISQTYKHYVIKKFKDVNGYIALEINQEEVHDSIHNVASLGKTAETYLTYKKEDKTYLATNRVKKAGNIGDIKEGEYISKGFISEGTDIKYGSLGDIELVGYMPIKIKNILLSMQTTVAYTDIISPIIKGFDYFEQFVKDHNYHNIMMIDPKGDIFYSVTKEDDYNTNIFSGKYANTHLLEAVNEVIKTKKFVLTDIDLYTACSKGLAQFALSPILKQDGTIQSIVVIQVSAEYLTKILIDESNIYKTFETYVVGQDKRLRSDTVMMNDKYTISNSFKNNIRIDTQAVKDGYTKGKGTAILKDYRNINVLSSFNLLEYPNFQWLVITEIDATEIETMLSGLKNNILLFVLISSLVALFVMILITNEKNKQDKKLHHTATHDSLTGLPNRKFALEFLSFMLANQKRLKKNGAVLFIDLDKFKIINDSYGHEAGDIVLMEVSKRLRSLLREEDLVARLGGDEFIVIVNNFSVISDIDKLCHKLIESISKPIINEERSYEVGISVGIATFPDDSNVAEELLQFSDTAMFRTKDNGRNGFTYYSSEMTERSLKISRVEEELKHAISNDELQLYYQPQIDIEQDRIVGVEALVRWNHPRDGLIMPNDFIPIAEESNLIVDLGYWVTREACTAFKRWKEAGVDIDYIAVNMSTKQLQCSQCVTDIVKVFEDLDFKAEWLELEITESTLISNLENTLSNINVFKEMGIQFSIDDFGTGYSSLSYLKSLRISTLKIDREFIKDILVDKDDRSIVSAIIAMGHTLNYTIVAEGAENKEEIILLQYLACDIVQGYYYSKPLPEDTLLAYIENKEWIK